MHWEQAFGREFCLSRTCVYSLSTEEDTPHPHTPSLFKIAPNYPFCLPSILKRLPLSIFSTDV